MFDVEVAKQVGVIAAILFQNIAFWCQHSQANDTNYFDGRYWTFNSVKAFKEMFPYLSASQIDTAMKKLVISGLIMKGNYNKSAYDRTIWYALSENGKCIFEKSKMEFNKIENGFPKNREPIPDINTYINTDINTNHNGRTTFVKPTAEELKAYALEIDYNLDPEAFLDYYNQNGWVIGKFKTKMKDWKAAVRQWKRHDQARGIDTRAKRSDDPGTVVLTSEEERLIEQVYANNGRDAWM